MSDNFFGKLDRTLGEMSAARDGAESQRSAAQKFSEQTIAALHPVARNYASKLKERGIGVQVSGNERGLNFQMHWADGGSHGLSLYPEVHTGLLKVTRNSTDHSTGKTFTSSDPQTYGEASWGAFRYEGALKSVIEDYVALADKHRGIA